MDIQKRSISWILACAIELFGSMSRHYVRSIWIYDSYHCLIGHLHLMHEYWQPGEMLPPVGRCSSPRGCDPTMSPGSLTAVLQTFQRSMDTQLANVCTKLDTINSRMDLLETRQKALEEETRFSTSSNTSVSPSVSGNRNRVTPAALQVRKPVFSI